MRFEYPDGATPIDANAAHDLRQPQITTQGQLNEAEQANILNAQLWARSRKHRDLLTESFVKRLHKRMFGDVWKWAGNYRTSELQNDRFAKSWEVPIQLRQLLADISYQIDHTQPKTAAEWDLLAAHFHHRLVRIHLFRNGNGRHAREMTDLLLIQNGQPSFTWGGASLIEQSTLRSQYITALREADGGSYSELVRFVRT